MDDGFADNELFVLVRPFVVSFKLAIQSIFAALVAITVVMSSSTLTVTYVSKTKIERPLLRPGARTLLLLCLHIVHAAAAFFRGRSDFGSSTSISSGNVLTGTAVEDKDIVAALVGPTFCFMVL